MRTGRKRAGREARGGGSTSATKGGRARARAASTDEAMASAVASTARRRGDQPVGRAFDLPATLFAGRALAAAFVTTLVACALGTLVEAIWLEVTDSTHVSLTKNLLDLARSLGIGLLLGLAAGVVTAVLAAWGSIMLRHQLAGSRLRARLWGLAFTTFAWAACVALVLHMSGFDLLGLWGYAVAAVPWLIALVMTWFWMPWVTRAATAERRP